MSKRTDGLDNDLSPNGAHPLYFVREPDSRRHGPYGCLREAQLACRNEMATIVDQYGRQRGAANMSA